jgi:hypothetical protein
VPLRFDNYGVNGRKYISFSADLNGDGNADLEVHSSPFGSHLVTAPGWQIQGISDSLLGFASEYAEKSQASRLLGGALVGGDVPWYVDWFSHDLNPLYPLNNLQTTGSTLLSYNTRPPGSGGGGWYLNYDGYVGLRYAAEDGYHYGWLRIEIGLLTIPGGRQVRKTLLGDEIVFSEWAWETEANVPISIAIPVSAVTQSAPLMVTSKCTTLLDEISPW